MAKQTSTIELSSTMLAICSRNRSQKLSDALRYLEKFNGPMPPKILIVDSSDDAGEVAKIQALSTIEWKFDVSFYASEKGLPLQRQVALDLAIASHDPPQAIFFFDDDIFPDPHFFETALRALNRDPSVIVVGGIDEKRLKHKWRMPIPLVRSHRGGKVLSSGFSDAPIGKSRFVDFVPGGFQLLRIVAAREIKFPIDREFFGEDVIFHYSIQSIGRVWFERDAVVQHRDEAKTLSQNCHALEGSLDVFRELGLTVSGTSWRHTAAIFLLLTLYSFSSTLGSRKIKAYREVYQSHFLKLIGRT